MENNNTVGDELRRSFTFTIDGEEKTFYLGVPTSEHIRKAEWHYSKVYNRALVEGVATASEMMDILTKRGIYGPDYEKKLQDIQIDLALAIADMHNTTDDDAKLAKAVKVDKLRNDLYQWNQRLTTPLSNSCEQIAENAKKEYLTSAFTQNEDGSLVWETYEDFVSETNSGLAIKARFEVMLLLEGLDSNFLENTPEQKVFNEINLRRQAEREAEATAPQLAAPEEEKPKKKRARRKAADKPAAKKSSAE